MAAVADYSVMIGFNFRGHFYKLEDIMELHIKETDNLRDKVKNLSERLERTEKSPQREPPKKKSFTEMKAFSRIEKFADDPKQNFRQWKLQITNLIAAGDAGGRELLKDVERETDPVEVDAYVGTHPDVDWLSSDLYLTLSLATEGAAFTIVENADGQGMEAWRRLCKEYDAKTPQNLQALLTSIIQPASV